MGLTDLTLAVFLGGMLQACTITAVNWYLRRRRVRSAQERLVAVLTGLAQSHHPATPEGELN